MHWTSHSQVCTVFRRKSIFPRSGPTQIAVCREQTPVDLASHLVEVSMKIKSGPAVEEPNEANPGLSFS